MIIINNIENFVDRVDKARLIKKESDAAESVQEQRLLKQHQADLKKRQVKEQRAKAANSEFYDSPHVREKDRTIIADVIKSSVLSEAVSVLLTTSDDFSKRYRLGPKTRVSNRYMGTYTMVDAENQLLIIEVHTGIQRFKKTGNGEGYYDDWGLVFTHNFKTNKLVIRISGQLKEYGSMNSFLDYLATEVVEIETEEAVIEPLEEDEEILDFEILESLFTWIK